jgi:hypothetical protein
VINPRLIGTAVGAWLGLAWAIGVGEALIVLALAVAGYAVGWVLTSRRRGSDEGEVMSWRWPRRREARTEARRRREARRTAAEAIERAPLTMERVSSDGAPRRNGVGRAAS